ncbi:MAG: 4Fe-4S binding protein [Planctomycetaceae bacterium]|jgi:NADH-quinone oxidoreductase subunit F|nr:4Fe-4S binding protein [Planctomycetaceae bacterium]
MSTTTSTDPPKMLKNYANAYHRATEKRTKRIVICAGTGCVANGSLNVMAALKEKIETEGLNVQLELDFENPSDNDFLHVSKSGCQGFCQMGPLLTVYPDHVLYTKVRPEDVDEIVETTLKKGGIVERLLYADSARNNKKCKGQGEIQFYHAQTRKVLEPCGVFDPEDVHEFIANGGYESARRAWLEMTPETICEEIKVSGLRGRGGGGFPTGVKWQFTLREKNEKKYIICNADEGDPGAFMDRSVMEGNPHTIIEGMMIAARGIGADEGYIYVRLEYPLAVARVRRAVEEAEKIGILGDDVFGTGKSFRVNVMEGAGAFVCGEETALMASIEGKRGMPRPKPPFPAQKGLWEKPTCINNVETLACVPIIIREGAQSYRKIGTESSPGTKTFALTGHVVNTGLIEVPFGATLREIIFDIGGGVIDSKGNVSNTAFKAVQIGGPSGGCLTEKHLDLPLDFDSLKTVGAMVGSGGLVVMNKDTCMVQMARFFMQFTQNESCGKCLLCREGTKQMLALLDEIIDGQGTAETLTILEQTAKTVGKGSLCALGKTAPNPVLSVLKNFRGEMESHVFNKRCPTGQCAALRSIEILQDKCVGCTACARKCPVSAISGERKQPHKINQELCIKCGVCVTTCKFGAVVGA